MKNYFFPPLTPSQRGILTVAGIGFYDLLIDNAVGVVVEEAEVTRALKILGARVLEETPSSLDGIISLALQFRDETGATTQVPYKRYGVKWTSWDGQNQKNFTQVVEEILVPAVRTDVVMSVPHGKSVAPVSDGKFHILIWSAPAGQASATPPRKNVGGRGRLPG